MELQKKLNEYQNKTNNINNNNYLEQINYVSKNKINEIKEDKDEDNQEYSDNEENFEKNENNSENADGAENQNNKKEEQFNKYELLDDEEVKKIRDKLLVERRDTTNLYNKIPMKAKKIEQIKRKDELEKKIAQINNELMQIRLRLKANKNIKNY